MVIYPGYSKPKEGERCADVPLYYYIYIYDIYIYYFGNILCFYLFGGYCTTLLLNLIYTLSVIICNIYIYIHTIYRLYIYIIIHIQIQEISNFHWTFHVSTWREKATGGFSINLIYHIIIYLDLLKMSLFKGSQ